MKYKDLQDLILHSSSTRKYFTSLPVPLQIALHEQNDYIFTAAQLHLRADLIQKYNHAVKNTTWN